jgi:molybdopterin-guanine dinucleotide biosynthesis protein B
LAAIVGFAGYSDSGKTTLICSLIDILQGKGKKVAVIKHDGHGHYKEAEGKDTSLFRQAGASAFVAVSPDSYTRYEKTEISLKNAVQMLNGCDYIFVEGFKKESHLKIAVFREPGQEEVLDQLTAPPIAIACGFPYAARGGMPVFELSDSQGLAEWLERNWATLNEGI